MHNDMVLMAAPSDSIASTSAHNGLLVALAETGLLGTVPLILLLFYCAKGVFRHRSSAIRPWAVATFAAGLTESMGESMLFSMGNPASLLFLLAVAALALPVQPDADLNDHQESNESG
jgi:O-antigen ligase